MIDVCGLVKKKRRMDEQKSRLLVEQIQKALTNSQKRIGISK